MLELRHFRYFVALAEELHFGRAAQRLNMSQPPLSQQIQAMEAQLGVRLFDRSKRKVELTAAGQVLLTEARKALAQAERAEQAVRRAGRGDCGRLDIGFTGSSPFSDVMPNLIGRFRSFWPDVHLSVREMSTSVQMAALVEGSLDIGFARPASEREVPGIVLHLVQRENLLFACHSAHPLAGRAEIRMADLACESFILHPRPIGTGLYDRVMSLAAGAGFTPNVVIEAHQMSAMVCLAAVGLGVSVVPEAMRRIHAEGLVLVPLTDPLAHIDLFIAHKRDHGNAVVGNFLSLLAAEAGDAK